MSEYPGDQRFADEQPVRAHQPEGQGDALLALTEVKEPLQDPAERVYALEGHMQGMQARINRLTIQAQAISLLLSEAGIGSGAITEGIVQLIAARDQLKDDRDKWRDAVIDAAVVNWTYTKQDAIDPKGTVNRLLCCAERMALDPRISEGARLLVEKSFIAGFLKSEGRKTDDPAQMLALYQRAQRVFAALPLQPLLDSLVEP